MLIIWKIKTLFQSWQKHLKPTSQQDQWSVKGPCSPKTKSVPSYIFYNVRSKIKSICCMKSWRTWSTNINHNSYFLYKFILNFKSSNLILKNIIIIYQQNVKCVCDFENIQKPIKLLKFFFDWPRPYLNSL